MRTIRWQHLSAASRESRRDSSETRQSTGRGTPCGISAISTVIADLIQHHQNDATHRHNPENPRTVIPAYVERTCATVVAGRYSAWRVSVLWGLDQVRSDGAGICGVGDNAGDAGLHRSQVSVAYSFEVHKSWCNQGYECHCSG